MITKVRAALRELRRVDPDALRAAADDAALVRAHQTDPNVRAYTATRTQERVDLVMWAGIVAGLLWTASTVQQWTVAEAGPDASVQMWITAWLTTAPVEIPLVAILLGEQQAARHAERPGNRTRAARLGLLAIMVVLNVWGPIAQLVDGDPATGAVGTLITHLFIVLAIVLATEAITDLRDTLGRAILAAATASTPRAATRRRRHSRPDEQQGGDRDTDEQQAPPNEPADGLTTRERGIRWALAHVGDDGEPPRPVVIRRGLFDDYGTWISRGESSRIRTDTRARLGLADEPDEADDQDESADGEEGTA